jgi:hypothetical protein
MHLELFLFRVLVSYAPIVGFLWVFFSHGALAMFLREWYAGYVTSHMVLVVVLITSFLSFEGAGVPAL